MTQTRPDAFADRIGRVPAQAHGLRLDKALALVFPGLAAVGLRARRRLCERGGVRLEDRIAGPASKVRAGDVLRLKVRDTAAKEAWSPLFSAAEIPAVVCRGTLFTALYKPCGLHSATVDGSPEPSLEALLPGLLDAFASAPDQDPKSASRSGDPLFFPCLLNRLDRETSGLVLAARSADGPRIWRNAENAGKTDKRYLAVLEGCLAAPLRVRAGLDTANRRITRVLDRPAADPLRRTEAAPLGVVPADLLFPGVDGVVTLAGCRILKGARHQIRAHLAWAGHPLAGDVLYGSGHAAPRFLLHHGSLRLPGFAASHAPGWLELLPEETAAAARAWLAKAD